MDKQGDSMVTSYMNLGVSNPGLQMFGSNECDISRASFQYIRRIPALYILRPKKNLRQLDSCQPSSQYELIVDGLMCCQITTPGRSIQKNPTTPYFHNRKIPRFDRNNPIMCWGQKNLLKFFFLKQMEKELKMGLGDVSPPTSISP